MTGTILRVAINTPLMQLFDYLPPDDDASAVRGKRVVVPFGRTRRIGVVCKLHERSELPHEKLRRAIDIIDDEPLFDEKLMSLLEWAASYYRYPPGEVFSAALPGPLRKGAAARIIGETRWRPTRDGIDADADALSRRARIQGRILRLLQATDDGLGSEDLAGTGSTWRDALRALEKKNLVERFMEEFPRQSKA
jgi:primosomal protein N' (replication factor Y)